MDPLRSLVRIYESEEPGAAFQALAKSISEQIPLRCAIWVEPERTEIVCTFPNEARLPAELLSMAVHVSQPEVFPVDSLSPVAALDHPDAEMLLLPLARGGGSGGSLVLISPAGTFGDRVEGWAEVGVALRRVAERHRLLDQMREERDGLRRRAQEMEALDVLGLAVNRTLDPDEVLNLVARFARTLLGAHYVVVSTLDGEHLRAVACVGIIGEAVAPDDEPFARRVLQAGKPVVLGEGAEKPADGEIEFHRTQEMRVGLGVPLSLFGETFGALVVGYRDNQVVSSRDTMLALTLARHAAVAINNSRLHAELSARSEELEGAYAELARVSKLKERFFASMSHELRTPINGVIGYQNLLLEGVAGEIEGKAKQYLEKSNRAAQNLLTLVNDILDYARIEAGKIEVETREVAVRELVEDAVAAVEPLAVEKNLELRLPAEYPSLQVLADPDRVRQILLNLLANAIKFTHEGEIALEISDGGEGKVELHVRDTGPGVPEEDRETIFLEFEQVKGTRGGTGLGLPISRKLAVLMGGDLWVESELGKGSTFILRLPRVPTEAGAGDMASDAA